MSTKREDVPYGNIISSYLKIDFYSFSILINVDLMSTVAGFLSHMKNNYDRVLISLKPLEILYQFLHSNFTVQKWKQTGRSRVNQRSKFFLPRPNESRSVDSGLGGSWAHFVWCINAAEKQCKTKFKVVRTTSLFLNTVLFLANFLVFRYNSEDLW